MVFRNCHLIILRHDLPINNLPILITLIEYINYSYTANHLANILVMGKRSYYLVEADLILHYICSAILAVTLI